MNNATTLCFGEVAEDVQEDALRFLTEQEENRELIRNEVYFTRRYTCAGETRF